MNAILYVSGESTPHRLAIPLPGTATSLAEVFPWRATSGDEDPEALRETLAILADPDALAEIAAADEAIAAGDVVHGTEAVRALRPRQ